MEEKLGGQVTLFEDKMSHRGAQCIKMEKPAPKSQISKKSKFHFRNYLETDSSMFLINHDSLQMAWEHVTIDIQVILE